MNAASSVASLLLAARQAANTSRDIHLAAAVNRLADAIQAQEKK